MKRRIRHLNRFLAGVTLAVLTTSRVVAQDSHPDRFGVGVSGIMGSFGGYDAVFPGIEGFVRVARGSIWSARVDGAYYGGHKLGDIVCTVNGGNGSCGDTRFISNLGTLVATFVIGPTASHGLRPYYGLLGAGGVAARWGGGTCSMDVTHCGQGVASGLGPTLALIEAGVGSEFRALGNNRIELRFHDASRSLLIGSSGEHHAAGASLTIGVVW